MHIIRQKRSTGHQSAKLQHKAGVISEDESQRTPGMLSIQNLRGLKALPLPFKSAIYQPSHLLLNRHTKKCTTKRVDKEKRIQSVFLLVWDNVEKVLEGTRSPWWRSKWMVLPGSRSHQAMMPPPVESSAEVLICPCFLTPPDWACSDQTAVNSEKATIVLPRGDSNCGSCQDNQMHCTEKHFDFCLFLWVRWLREGCSTWNWSLPRLQPRDSFVSVFIVVLTWTHLRLDHSPRPLRSNEKIKTTAFNISILEDFSFGITNYGKYWSTQTDFVLEVLLQGSWRHIVNALSARVSALP